MAKYLLMALGLFAIAAFAIFIWFSISLIVHLEAASEKAISIAELTNGRAFKLTEPVGSTDTICIIWEAEDKEQTKWRELDVQITYSEDGSWTRDPALIAIADDQHLLVRRGGIWTDCIELGPPVRNCAGTQSYLARYKPDDWIRQSDEIERITGLSPGPKENRQHTRHSPLNHKSNHPGLL